MAKLSCNVESCVNNVGGGFCTAATIHITGSDAHRSKCTDCSTYAPKSFKNALASMANTNYTGEVAQLFSASEITISPNIICESVNCIYNKQKDCTASNVQIYGPHAVSDNGTECETFVER
ncbi:hypothetical protein CPJCM30710_08700 [Clostridium polyendosporum]|uniref:DUF1540 domain-containing protein n=1 Tax=Clostridium polyendosporum TaxID=69208 RepID=A0A919RYP5_9CLOT|nr:DUF1540 domain-containing protein [Clostridium polyendosporum]GIM28204.1 hypothetical protein CPJCM30710_08700 [Clostridium polyendosporum]